MNLIEQETSGLLKFHSREWVNDLRSKIEKDLAGKEITKESIGASMQRVLFFGGYPEGL